ncbi:MAG: ABC transporter permease [Thermoguttaceae bacterium]
MSETYISLSYGQMLLAAGLIVVSGGISLGLQLGLERRLVVAAFRTVVQLLLIGLVLRWIFQPGQWLGYILVLMSAMTLIAGFSAVQRLDHRYAGIRLDSILATWLTSWAVTWIALFGIIRIDLGNLAQYGIPLLGMILGNTLNGVSLGLGRLGDELTGRRDQVETLLALGATRWEAARQPIQQAVRTGMVPTINAMMVVGLVSLPGMMTGQLLGGVPPLQAVMYQIVIMFLLAAATSLGTVGAVLLAYRRLFNQDHQFLYSAIVPR